MMRSYLKLIPCILANGDFIQVFLSFIRVSICDSWVHIFSPRTRQGNGEAWGSGPLHQVSFGQYIHFTFTFLITTGLVYQTTLVPISYTRFQQTSPFVGVARLILTYLGRDIHTFPTHSFHIISIHNSTPKGYYISILGSPVSRKGKTSHVGFSTFHS